MYEEQYISLSRRGERRRAAHLLQTLGEGWASGHTHVPWRSRASPAAGGARPPGWALRYLLRLRVPALHHECLQPMELHLLGLPQDRADALGQLLGNLKLVVAQRWPLSRQQLVEHHSVGEHVYLGKEASQVRSPARAQQLSEAGPGTEGAEDAIGPGILPKGRQSSIHPSMHPSLPTCPNIQPTI